ncbi:MAG: RNA-binding S4 domain-containing protein, partial [Sideroxydans sp.]
MNEPAEKLRIDKWLWAARFFKTRSLAADAVEAGRVTMNEARIKPAKTIGAGDRLVIRLGQYHFDVEVLALSGKR